MTEKENTLESLVKKAKAKKCDVAFRESGAKCTLHEWRLEWFKIHEGYTPDCEKKKDG